MTSTFSTISSITLCEETMIAGTYKELSFDAFDADSNPIDISSFTYTWMLSPFGHPEVVSVSKIGVFRSDISNKNRFTIYLLSTDTASLSGKYIHQPVISGNPGYDFRLGQGYINILPANG